METVGTILLLLALLMFVIGVVNIIHPIEALWIPTRKRAILVLGCSIVVFVVAGLVAGTSTEDGQSLPSDGPTPETSTATTQPPTTTTTQPPTTTTTQPPQRAGIGDPVRDGKFEFVVTGVEQPGKTFGSEVLEDEALGTWFVVRVNVTNIGNEPQSFFADSQELILGDVTYQTSFTFNGTTFEELNPGLSFDAILLFDVPENFPLGGTGTVLELHDSIFSGGVEVWL